MHYGSHLKLNPSEMDILQDQFVSYQVLNKEDIPQHVWEESAVFDEGQDGLKHYKMDKIWSEIGSFKNVEGSYRFELLAKVAKYILVILHSNAGEERVFILIRQNITPTKSCLDTNGALSSIVKLKLGNRQSCGEWSPPKSLFDASKEVYHESEISSCHITIISFACELLQCFLSNLTSIYP